MDNSDIEGNSGGNRGDNCSNDHKSDNCDCENGDDGGVVMMGVL